MRRAQVLRMPTVGQGEFARYLRTGSMADALGYARAGYEVRVKADGRRYVVMKPKPDAMIGGDAPSWVAQVFDEPIVSSDDEVDECSICPHRYHRGLEIGESGSGRYGCTICVMPEARFAALRKTARDEIVQQFGIPPSMLVRR